MAQHPQQQQLQSRQKQQPACAAVGLQHQQAKSKTTTTSSQQQQHQQHLEQDGKRTLIKNQLYLIEQLQLENANLRNERDQLQLENEELKFQLQMISSSNILGQPGATFKSPQLERLVAPTTATTNATASANGAKLDEASHQLQANGATNLRASLAQAAVTPNQIAPAATATPATTNQNHRLLTTPFRQPMRQLNGDGQHLVSSVTTQASIATTVRVSASTAAVTTNNTNAIAPSTDIGTELPSGKRIGAVLDPLLTGWSGVSKLMVDGKSTTSIIAFNSKGPSSSQSLPQSRSLPQDDEEQRVTKLLEQRYGDSEKVQAAAIIIQRAFRKYQICKRFRTITEQLRHTHQSGSSQASGNDRRRESPKPPVAKTTSPTTPEVPYASGTTRAAAWESLSYAASRLAASAAAATSGAKQLTNGIGYTRAQSVSSSQTASSRAPNQSPDNNRQSLTTGVVSTTTANQPNKQQHQAQQDPVVAAAINFQQLESIRKRQYRVGLNIFNKNPEKGVSFLVAHSFIDSTSPYTKTSTNGYYHSVNQLHFIDHTKQHYLVQQHLPQSSQPQQALPQSHNCQLCCEEDNLKRNVAHFLLHRKGLAKEKIGQYLGNLQAQFNQDVLKYYLQELDFYGLQIDLALRKFLSTFRLPGEAQKIERIVDCFAQRYVQCQQQQQRHQHLTDAGATNANIVTQIQMLNQQQQSSNHQQQPTTQQQNQQQQQKHINNTNYKNNLMLLSKDEIFILTFAIIMLNTDLHSPSLKPTSRMSATQFVNNLRGVFKSQTINESDLIEIYERVKANQIATTPDHVTHVMKVQQGLTVTNFQRKELPNLCVPHRRLVCFCRLFEVYDVNKKERVGQHQREIFLFNDLLLVTKLARRVRANTTQLYAYRQSISLQGLYVQLFLSAHYNFGIKLCQRSNDETLIMFNARNELDQSRFVDDLSESIAEMDEMETIKAHNIIETIHFKHLDRLRLHAMLHVPSRLVTTVAAGNANENFQAANHLGDDNQQPKQAGKMFDLMNSCDTRITNNKLEPDEDRSNKQQSFTTEVTEAVKTTATAKATTSDISDGRVKAKFNSMLNLSSAAEGRKVVVVVENSTADSNQSHLRQQSNKSTNGGKGLRQNQSFVVQHQRVSTSNQSSGTGERVISNASVSAAAAVATASGGQRRCSTSSLHSLDSGLFLSRDVSPNQSS